MDGCGELAGILAAGVGAGSHCAPFSDDQLAARRVGAEASGTISQLQRQVASALGRLQQRLGVEQGSQGILRIVSVSSEQAVDGLLGRVDVVVELGGGRRVAVEVDGPTHFLANDPHTRTKDGSTQLRDRQLGRLFGAGNVLSVPYWEWYELRGDGSRKGRYLLRLLGLDADGPDS
ncbi:hypothetical protein TSOC_011886 [Tetrabaena socialis]|uniref:RAP domain-containing protein n=1 Tax=Tetrabaena socialis TaxID=47790 RepID=A0A2J7ZPG4_9CHLO|nr:hypothetical protein TSOC_011886 [Tetrabaena socialis]|eukprot:PNH02163.1 hypothetical protein TSOC_011886 [Tetrabaena socialis]